MLDTAKWKNQIRAILSLDSRPELIAAGFAVGVFISFTPFYGFHTLLAITAAFLLRLNKVTCVAGSMVNTPLTAIPLLSLSYRLGRMLSGLPPQKFHIVGLEWHQLKMYATSLAIGSSLLGGIAFSLSYIICYKLLVRSRRKAVTAASSVAT